MNQCLGRAQDTILIFTWPMYYQGTGQLEIRGRQYRLVLEGSLAHLRGLGDDWMISPPFSMVSPVKVVVGLVLGRSNW